MRLPVLIVALTLICAPLGASAVAANGEGHRAPRGSCLSRPERRQGFASAIAFIESYRDPSKRLRSVRECQPERRTRVSAHVFDDFDEFVQAVAVVPGELDQFLGPLDDDTTFGCPGDRNAKPASELE